MTSVEAPLEELLESLQEIPRLTPVPEETDETDFEAPPGIQKWLEENAFQSSSCSLTSTVTDSTTENDEESRQLSVSTSVEKVTSFQQPLPQKETEKIRELLSNTEDASVIKARTFATKVRPPPTPPQDVSAYTNSRRTARSKEDRERLKSNSEALIESLLQSQRTSLNSGQITEGSEGNTGEGQSSVEGVENSEAKTIGEEEYNVPVQIKDDNSQTSSDDDQPRREQGPSENLSTAEHWKNSIVRDKFNILQVLKEFIASDFMKTSIRDYFELLPPVVWFTFAGVASVYAMFAALILLFMTGGLLALFIFCIILSSTVISGVLFVGLIIFSISFIFICTFVVSFFTMIFAARRLYVFGLELTRKSKIAFPFK